MNKVTVLYHANCADGFCAAWVVRMHYRFQNVTYRPVMYGQPMPKIEDGSEVLIVDFSYPRETLLELAARCGPVVVLDHHKTAQENLAGLEAPTLSVHFDMQKSGARLTWEYLYGSTTAPWLVDYTEDRDLWRWKLPESRAINAALASYPRDFPQWDLLADLNEPLTTLAREGWPILRYQDQLIETICHSARKAVLGGHEVLAVNTSCLFSECAGKLAEGRPFGAAWFIRGDGKRQWSLRSREGGIDVAAIAKQYGGGGHAVAAGFEADFQE